MVVNDWPTYTFNSCVFFLGFSSNFDSHYGLIWLANWSILKLLQHSHFHVQRGWQIFFLLFTSGKCWRREPNVDVAWSTSWVCTWEHLNYANVIGWLRSWDTITGMELILLHWWNGCHDNAMTALLCCIDCGSLMQCLFCVSSDRCLPWQMTYQSLYFWL